MTAYYVLDIINNNMKDVYLDVFNQVTADATLKAKLDLLAGESDVVVDSIIHMFDLSSKYNVKLIKELVQ